MLFAGLFSDLLHIKETMFCFCCSDKHRIQVMKRIIKKIKAHFYQKTQLSAFY